MAAEALQIVRDLLSMRDVRRAEVQIARLLRGDPLNPADEARVLVLRARARLLGARPEEALEDLDAASKITDEPTLRLEIEEIRGDAYFARFELASVGFADRTHVERADEVYRSLAAAHPDYTNLGWIHYQRGRICLIDGRAEDAVTAFSSALLAPSPIPALTAYCFERLGFVALYEQRDPRRSLSFLDKALFTYPPGEDRVWLARLQTLRARALRALHDLGGATAAVEEALAIANATDETRIALADALLTAAELLAAQGGRDRDVIARLQQFLSASRRPLGIDVTWSRAHEMLGNAYFNLGQYGAAADAYQSALQHNPYHPWAISLHYQIARAYYLLEDFERAIRAIDVLMDAARKEEQPVTDYRVYDVLGSAHFALKQYRPALTAYDRALELAPPTIDVEKIRRYRQFAAELGG